MENFSEKKRSLSAGYLLPENREYSVYADWS